MYRWIDLSAFLVSEGQGEWGVDVHHVVLQRGVLLSGSLRAGERMRANLLMSCYLFFLTFDHRRIEGTSSQEGLELAYGCTDPSTEETFLLPFTTQEADEKIRLPRCNGA